jgi:DNA-directed RNA polymerase specialized sigma24 family protein
LLAAERRARTVRRLALLPAILRAVFELRIVTGLSTADTAFRLRITPEAVRTRLSRARRALLAV